MNICSSLFLILSLIKTDFVQCFTTPFFSSKSTQSLNSYAPLVYDSPITYDYDAPMYDRPYDDYYYGYDNYMQPSFDPYYRPYNNRYNNYVQRRPYQRLDYTRRRPNDPLINPYNPYGGSGSSSIGYAGYGNGYSSYNRGYGYIHDAMDYAGDRPSLARQVLRSQMPTHIQGNSLKTWITQPYVEAVHVALKSEGRPIHADVELWNGPNNIPYRLRVYVEDGHIRPFSATVGTPYGTNTICVRNISPIEYPLEAAVAPEHEVDAPSREMPLNYPMIIQGNSLQTFRFHHEIQSVQVMLKTDGRPLNARIELWQGPSNVKQMVDVYTDDGLERPFFMNIETPSGENVVRVVNTGTLAFPIDASVEAYSVGMGYEYFSGAPGAMLIQ